MCEQSKIRQSILIYLVRWSNKCNGKKRKTRVLQASADDYWHKKIYVKQNIGWYRNTLFTLIWGDLCCTNISVNFWCTGGSPPEALRVYIIYICQQYTLTSAAKRPFKTNSRNTSFLFYFTTLACPCCFPHCFNSL